MKADHARQPVAPNHFCALNSLLNGTRPKHCQQDERGGSGSGSNSGWSGVVRSTIVVVVVVVVVVVLARATAGPSDAQRGRRHAPVQQCIY
jgi:hypothetical protein